MRFAYADPPYPGMTHLYKDHPDYAGEVDHKALIERLVAEFPDGWALSTAAYTLQQVLLVAPTDVRVMPWCTTNSKGMPGTITPSWQPLILRGGRRRPGIVRDYLVSAQRVGGELNFLGGKPELYCFWLFRCLGALPGDELIDLFPGSGAVSRAWEKYQRQIPLPTDRPKAKNLRLPLDVQSSASAGG